MPSEFEVIARFFTRPARTAALGVGDDCALVRIPADLALAPDDTGTALRVRVKRILEPREFGTFARGAVLLDHGNHRVRIFNI